MVLDNFLSFIAELWEWVSNNTAELQSVGAILTAVFTLAAATAALFYLIATRRLWQESQLSNSLQKLQFIPHVITTVENPQRSSYELVFTNDSQFGVFVDCEVFIDFVGYINDEHRSERTTEAVKVLKFTLPAKEKRSVLMQTFFELGKRGLGQYAPHRLRVEGSVEMKASKGTESVIKEELSESFHCIMENYVPDGKIVPFNEMRSPDAWDWRWLIFNLGEYQASPEDTVEPWNDDELPEEFKPSNNNTDIYMQTVLKRSYAFLDEDPPAPSEEDS